MKSPWIHKLYFLFRSTNAHGVHSPFVFEWITKCLYKERTSKQIHIDLSPRFHQSLGANQIQILQDSLQYLEFKNIQIAVPKSHGISKLATESNIQSSLDLSEATNAIFISAFQKKIVLDPESLKNKGAFCLILEAPYRNTALWNRLKKIFTDAVIVDTFYWGFIFLGKSQEAQKFNIRTKRFLKWDYRPIRL